MYVRRYIGSSNLQRAFLIKYTAAAWSRFDRLSHQDSLYYWQFVSHLRFAHTEHLTVYVIFESVCFMVNFVLKLLHFNLHLLQTTESAENVSTLERGDY